MKRAWVSVSLLTVAMLAAACGGEERFPAGGSAAGRIAFVSDRDDYLPMYLMNSDGSGLLRLPSILDGQTFSPDKRHIDFDRRWSPDGKQVVVTRGEGFGSSSHVVETDGSDDFFLVEDIVESPAWSPDGKRIVFASDRDGDDIEIYVIDADGSGLVSLTDNSAHDFAPAWSPDGDQIAFQSGRDGNWEIYVMNADGSGQTNLTTNPLSDVLGCFDLGMGGCYLSCVASFCHSIHLGAPWSPNGKQIAFASGCSDLLVCDLNVINADGSGLTNLTNHPGSAGEWAWSPDGSRVAYESSRDTNAEIYVVSKDGSGIRNLTSNQSGDLAPAWSPDGNQVAFQSDRDDNWEIYVMNADGSNPINLSKNSADDWLDAWLPVQR